MAMIKGSIFIVLKWVDHFYNFSIDLPKIVEIVDRLRV